MENEVLELDSTFAEVQGRGTNTQNVLVPTENTGATAITSISSGTSGIGASVVGGVATLVSPLTTKGDIFVHNATAGTRLPVGADGSQLTANSGVGTGLSWVTPIKDNFSAVIAPAVTDDTAGGYAIGSQWVDTALKDGYICVDATNGAAVWKKTTP